METKERIALLDSLLSLNEQAGLPENNVIGLVDFLAGLPDGERDAILEHIRQGDRFGNFKRFAGFANREPEQRSRILKALGIQASGKKGFLQELIDSTSGSAGQAKQVMGDIAQARKNFQEGFLEPLAGLFGFRTKGKS